MGDVVWVIDLALPSVFNFFIAKALAPLRRNSLDSANPIPWAPLVMIATFSVTQPVKLSPFTGA